MRVQWGKKRGQAWLGGGGICDSQRLHTSCANFTSIDQLQPPPSWMCKLLTCLSKMTEPSTAINARLCYVQHLDRRKGEVMSRMVWCNPYPGQIP